MYTVKITGVEAIDKKLRSMEPKLAKKVIRQALRSGLKPMLNRARELAPEGPSRFIPSRGVSHAGGSMKKKIKIRATRSRKAIRLALMIGKGDYTGEQFYASFPEYGTKHQRPQRPMGRAFEEYKESSKEIIISEILRGIEDIAKGG